MECSVDGCDKLARTRGWCPAHYARVRKYGTPGTHPVQAWHAPSGSEPDGIRVMHARMRRAKGPASAYVCHCGQQAMDWAYNHQDPTPKLSRDRRGTWMWWSDDPDMYVPMCRKCHRGMDAKRASAELAEYRQQKYAQQQQ